MIMSNKAFAEKLYNFLKNNDETDRYASVPQEDCIAELESYLSDLAMVKETIKDIEEISDMFDDHEFYVTDIKPLLYGLRELQSSLEAEQNRRMINGTNYEVKHAIHIGDKETLFAEDKKAVDGMYWFVCDYTENDICGKYTDCQVGDNFLEAMQEFTERVSKQIEAMKSEINQSKTPCEVFTAEHCYTNDRGQSIEDKIVAVRADILRPEYRRGDVQLVLVSGGNGARGNSRGNAVFCYHLNNGEHTRFERYNIQGEVKPEHLPKWAKDKAAEILAEKASPQRKSKDREER